jgi:hypothetical protein
MPITHEVDVARNLMRVRRWGSITSQDEEAAARLRREDPLVVAGIKVVVDCTEVEPPDTTEVVKYLADQAAAQASRLNCGPLAIVVSSDVEYGMARMYMAYTEMEHPWTNVFRSMDEALAWLDSQG